ncbi:hypothetical protein GCM10027343_09960 [Noviherbaspirillum agri]
MAATASNFLLQQLSDRDVRRIDGYRGDDVNGIMYAFRRMGGEMQFVQARHSFSERQRHGVACRPAPEEKD